MTGKPKHQWLALFACAVAGLIGTTVLARSAAGIISADPEMAELAMRVATVIFVTGTVFTLAFCILLAMIMRPGDSVGDPKSAIYGDVFDSLGEGVTVFGPDLRLITSNRRFQEIYELPDELVQPGISIEDFLSFNLERGEFTGNLESLLERMNTKMRQAGHTVFEETRRNGRTIQVRRSRTQNGNIVSLYVDVTDRKAHEKELSRALDLLRATFDSMNDGILVIDSEMKIRMWNERLTEMMNVTPGTLSSGVEYEPFLMEQAHSGILKISDPKAFAKKVMDSMSIGEDLTQEVAVCNGKTVEIRRRRMAQGGYICTYTDITHRKLADSAIRASEERYALAAAGTNDGLWDWDLVSDRLHLSDRWIEMLGLHRDKVAPYPESILDRMHPKDMDGFREALDNHLEGRSEQLRAEFRLLHNDDHYVWMLCRGVAVRDGSGKAVRITGSMTDISERKRAEEKLLKDAFYDPTTGLPNRALFLDRVSQHRKKNGGKPGNFAVLFLDVDRFKMINDSLGHEIGDNLLIDVARRLERAIKPEDIVARLSGDEFAILVTDISGRNGALDAIAAIRSELAAAFYLLEREIFITAAIGVALSDPALETAEDMLRAADIAMYRAKDGGLSNYVFYDPQMQSRAISMLQMESDLRRAVEREEFDVQYQPIVDFSTGSISGFETLVRWEHPEKGPVSPNDFIPLAESTGLIGPIGAQVLRKACRQMHEWREHFGKEMKGTVSVNLSIQQLNDRDLVREIGSILEDTLLPGEMLKLEVTESMIMQNPDQMARTLTELKSLGVTLSIDDFGTGYSSLSYLHRFPFDTLKIDKDFVISLDEKPENVEIIRTICLLAHNMGMDVVAEGVESEHHVRQLVELACEYGQGYLFSRPKAAKDITEMLGGKVKWDIAEMTKSVVLEMPKARSNPVEDRA